MDPRVVIISGPSESAVYSLAEGEVSVGRDDTNRLPIDDPSVSRHHCIIRHGADGFELVDLESHNGTFVNDVPAKEHQLKHGDRIKIGNSLLLFLVDEAEAAPGPDDVLLDEETVLGDSSSRFSVEEALYSASRDLSALINISTVINSTRGLQPLQRALLELLLDAIPAQRGAILLLKEGTQDFGSLFSMDKNSGDDATLRVSRTVAQEVVREGVAILGNEVLKSGEFGGAQSLTHSRVQSLLCVPLSLFNRVVGIIYFDTCDASARFKKSHLELVTAVANIAAGALHSARHVELLEAENQRLRDDSKSEHNMVGESESMRGVYFTIGKVAIANSTVLLRGESGTGKELAARAIHRKSPRHDKPFVAVNCATLTESLLESELFGHERGAFTGAVTQKKGKIELADNGTLFLDEVGEISISVQAKLLRVIQEREFERLGGTRAIKVDIRIVAATNRDLWEMIERGQFRQDLYYRLNVVSLRLPPLRERAEDILLLANYFVAKYAARCKRHVTSISSEASMKLTDYHWPGNVRELENAIERAVVLGSTEQLLAEDLPETLLETGHASGDQTLRYYDLVKESKKKIVLNAIQKAGGDFREAASALGIHPNNLHRLVRNLEVKIHPGDKGVSPRDRRPADTTGEVN